MFPNPKKKNKQGKTKEKNRRINLNDQLRNFMFSFISLKLLRAELKQFLFSKTFLEVFFMILFYCKRLHSLSLSFCSLHSVIRLWFSLASVGSVRLIADTMNVIALECCDIAKQTPFYKWKKVYARIESESQITK